MGKFGLKSKSLSLAGVLAYVLILLNALTGFVLTPFLLRSFGDSTYGVYTTMNSFTSALMIIDIGVTQTLIRYIAKYRASNKSDDDISILCHTIKLINYFVCILCFLGGIIMFFIIPSLYSKSFDSSELKIAINIYFFFVGSIIFSLLSNYYTGIISGYEYFSFINITKTVRILLRIISIFVFVYVFKSVYCLVVIDLTLSIINYLVYLLFERKNINIKKSKEFVSRILMKEIAIYTLLIFIQSLVDQVNNNLDNIIIGAVVNTIAVTVYSFGLTIFHIFQNLSTSISQMLIPYMSNKIENGASNNELEMELIRIGKVQFIIVGAILFCFSVLGKRFVSIWLGEEYLNVYYVALILMCGGIIPLIQNGAIAILKVKNLLLFRTISLFIMALLNAVITYFLVKQYGYVFASIGTAIGFVLVNVIIMDIYYYKVLKLNMLKVLFKIIVRILPCCFLASIVTLFLSRQMNEDLFNLIVLMVIFVFVYFVLLLLFGLEKQEKHNLFNRIFKKKE